MLYRRENLRTAFIKYGIYDNDLSPFGIEDLDWGLRVTKKGAKLKCFSDAEVFHMHKRGQKSSKENMMHIIISRMVFLRKNFTLFNLLRETSHFILCLKDYGFKFTLSNYKKGIKKNIIPGNYEYNLFKMNIDKYYA